MSLVLNYFLLIELLLQKNWIDNAPEPFWTWLCNEVETRYNDLIAALQLEWEYEYDSECKYQIYVELKEAYIWE